MKIIKIIVGFVLSIFFPPKLGKIEKADLDGVLLLQAIEKGIVKTYRPEHLPEAGVLGVFEWTYGPDHAPRQIK